MKINLLKVPVYYINLDKDTAKAEKLESLLYDIGFEQVERFAGTQIATPKVGCATSHQAILEKLKDHSGPFIILEDDASLAKLQKEIEVPEDADAVYLGNSRFGLYDNHGQLKVSAERVDDKLYRVYNMLGAHAILYLNNSYARFLANAISFNIDIKDNQDKVRASTMKYFNIYTLNTPFFYQEGKHEKVTRVKINKINLVDKAGAS